jgi:hypothetical protein
MHDVHASGISAITWCGVMSLANLPEPRVAAVDDAPDFHQVRPFRARRW